MRKILLIAKRDFLATVRSKAFVFGLIMFPILWGGGFAVTSLLQNRENQTERLVALLDRTGKTAGPMVEALEKANREGMYDKNTGRQTMPRYHFEIVAPAGDMNQQRLALSGRVRAHQLFAFLEIGPAALEASGGPDKSSIRFYSGEGGVQGSQGWMVEPLNNTLRRMRLQAAGLDSTRVAALLEPVRVEGFNLVTRDPATGAIVEPKKRGAAESFGVPFAMVMLLGLIVLFTSMPLLTIVAEDKLQRVYEMLLSSVSPFQLISGKVLAAIAGSLASSAFYIIGGILMLEGLAMFGLIPFSLLPWFFVYLVAEVTMLGALAAALGSACSTPRDSQQLAIVVMLPVMIPLIMMGSLLQQPNGNMALLFSFFPLFTPMTMLLRQAMPGGVPLWQPIVGLAGVFLCTVLITWAAARIFRIGVLFQGTIPKLPELLRWAVRG